ncbi:hypothetical protein SCLCIDRAFT_840454 [Scleroderma citrinum Foug A]|uniref:Uncharacterized protein n=1 Tax=Scleroderma citrinum Foug A TaxID=1036808 RepID=A0A0C3DNL0_9AGAM|nr:hypothetical protein SCLCIDRAFT_840454 [Scleroderma citrinum Foug A]
MVLQSLEYRFGSNIIDSLDILCVAEFRVSSRDRTSSMKWIVKVADRRMLSRDVDVITRCFLWYVSNRMNALEEIATTVFIALVISVSFLPFLLAKYRCHGSILG